MCGSGAPEIEWSAADWAGGTSGSIEKKYAVQDTSDDRGHFSTDLSRYGHVEGYDEDINQAYLFDSVLEADTAIRKRPQGDTAGRFIVVPIWVETETKTTTTTTRRKS